MNETSNLRKLRILVIGGSSIALAMELAKTHIPLPAKRAEFPRKELNH